MASPTHAEVWTQIANLCDILENLSDFCDTETDNWIGMEDVLVQSLEGDYVGEVLPVLRSMRGALSAMLSPENVQALFAPFILELGKVYGYPERDIGSLMSRIYDEFVAQSYTLKRRELTLGTPAVVSATGTGRILRCTVDENNNPIPTTHLETVTAECIADGRQTFQEEEVFELRGQEAEPDFLSVVGSGKVDELRMLSARDSENLLGNPSFSADAVSASPTVITDWTVGTIGNFEIDSTKSFRGFPGDTTPRSLKVTASDTITQIIEDTRNARLDPNVPYWLQCAIFRETGATGNIILRMGATNRTIALSTLNANSWNVVDLVSGGPDNTCWLKTFNEVDLDIKIEVASLAVASVFIDDIILAPGKFFDGHYYWCVPGDTGTHVSWVRLDSWNWADSLSVEGIIQKWLWRGRLGYLIDTAGAETITDPAG